MLLQQALGFFCSLLIGLCLGLMGGGGSILTIPVLVYLLNINPLLSTAYSLFVVGTTSLVGAIHYALKREVHYRAAVLFALPSFVTIFLIRRYVVPAIPNPILTIESFQLSKTGALMALFGLVMLLASIRMLTDRNPQANSSGFLSRYDLLRVLLTGLFVGALTGLVGIGGGFLIVPALVLLVRLPMKKAVGTSLVIIAVNGFIGFASNMNLGTVQWPFLATFTTLAILGILIGAYASRFVSGLQLRSVFGWLVLGLSLFILAKETLLPIHYRKPATKLQFDSSVVATPSGARNQTQLFAATTVLPHLKVINGKMRPVIP